MEIEKGEYVEPSWLTFADFAERWLRDYAAINLAPKTFFRYKQLLGSRILPAMGHLKLEQIKPLQLMEFYRNLQEDGIREDGKAGGLSEKAILYNHQVISSILRDAVQWQVLSTNPASRVKPPKVSKKQAAYEEQTTALPEAATQEPIKYRMVIVLEVATGLRRGELTGLEWKDIDFERGTVEVRQANQYLPSKGVFTKEPKTETSKRILAIPPSVVALIKEYRASQLEERLKARVFFASTFSLFLQTIFAAAPQ